MRRYRRYRGSANGPGHAHRVCSAIDPAVAVLRCKGRRIAAHIGGRRRTANGQLDGAITTPVRRLSAAGIGQATALHRIADNTFTHFAFAGAGICTGNSGIGNCPCPRHCGQFSRRIAFSKSLDIPLTIRPGDVGRSLSRQIAIRTDELKVLAKRYSLELIAVGECVFHVRYRTGIEAAQIQSFQAIALVEHHLQALDLCGIEITQIQRSQGFTAMEHTIHLSCIRRVETTEAIDRCQGIAGIEHLPHVLCRRRIPTCQVQCCELLISTEDAVEIRHLRGVKAAQIQCLDRRQAIEHGLHDRDVGRIQLIQPGELRQRAKCVECAGGVRIRHDLPVPIAGKDQLSAVNVTHNAAVLRRRSIPGFGRCAAVDIDDFNFRDNILCRSTLIPRILSRQGRFREAPVIVRPIVDTGVFELRHTGTVCNDKCSHGHRYTGILRHVERAKACAGRRTLGDRRIRRQELYGRQLRTIGRHSGSQPIHRGRERQVLQRLTAIEHILAGTRCSLCHIPLGDIKDFHALAVFKGIDIPLTVAHIPLAHIQFSQRFTAIECVGHCRHTGCIPLAHVQRDQLFAVYEGAVELHDLPGVGPGLSANDLCQALTLPEHFIESAVPVPLRPIERAEIEAGNVNGLCSGTEEHIVEGAGTEDSSVALRPSAHTAGIPCRQVQRTQTCGILKGTIHRDDLRGIPARHIDRIRPCSRKSFLQRGQAVGLPCMQIQHKSAAIGESEAHIRHLLHIPAGHIQRSQASAVREDTLQRSHIGGIPTGDIQRCQRTAAVEHTVRRFQALGIPTAQV